MTTYRYNIWDTENNVVKEVFTDTDEQVLHNLIRCWKKYNFVKSQLDAGTIRIEYVGVET